MVWMCLPAKVRGLLSSSELMERFVMAKKVLLVGHCGPDSSYLRMAIKRAVPEADILMADDSDELSKSIQNENIDLILFNRELGYGFDPDEGVEAIRVLRQGRLNTKMMLVSNYQDAQQAAVSAGAMPGFGKRELGTPRVTELLREALGVEVAK
jgi:two-component system chemotaxis response regulator CheY